MDTADLKPAPPPEQLDPQAPAPAAETPAELAEEQQLGATAAGRAANAALRSLSRAARAFTLYDPSNETVHRFLEDFRDRTQEALKVSGELVFEVRPFELVLGKDVVYLERDRERSLAFRLFRDGVRELSIGPQVKWEELLRLLEVLSVRFVGVREQEDDLVTLLDKAAFANIHFAAVEGFVAHDDEEDPSGSEFASGARSQSLQHAEVPPDFDLPLPAAAEPKPFAYRPVPAPYLQQLQAEECAATLPHHALRLVRELLAASASPATRIGLEDAVRVAGEVRDYFVADRQFASLLQLVELARSMTGPAATAFAPLLTAMGSAATLGQLIDGLGHDLEVPPAELVKLLERVPGEHVRHLAGLLDQQQEDGPRRKLLKATITKRAAAEPEPLMAAVTERSGASAVELFALLREALPQRAVPTAVALSARADPALQCAALEVLAGAPTGSEEAARAVAAQLEAKDSAVRLAAIRAASLRRDLRGFDLISKDLQKRASSLTVEEATTMGEALARIVPENAQALFTPWVNAKGSLLKRIAETPASRMLKFAAVAGLGFCPGPEPEKLIRELAAQTDDEELKQHCVATMVRRRKEGSRPRG